MKKIQIGTLAIAAVLAIGGGSVFASEKAADYKSVIVDGVEIESQDKELLKAIENGEVEISVDTTKSVPVQKVGGVEIESEDEELLKAIANGEIEIIVATESVPAQEVE